MQKLLYLDLNLELFIATAVRTSNPTRKIYLKILYIGNKRGSSECRLSVCLSAYLCVCMHTSLALKVWTDFIRNLYLRVRKSLRRHINILATERTDVHVSPRKHN
jgi:hypothetical protein